MRQIDADYLTTEIARLVVGGKHAIEEAGHGNFWINGLYDVKKMIDISPTVELTEEQAIEKLHETGWLIRHDKEMTERPQGEWLHKKVDCYLKEHGQCSNCLQRERVGNFCRNCGADMRGADHETG